MSLFKNSLALIEAGRRGENKGLPIRFNRLIDYVPNIQKATYYLIGGETGSGKTSLADDLFLFTPYDYITRKIDKKGKDIDKRIPINQLPPINEKLKVIYYSFEIDKHIKIIKGISRRLYLDYDIITDVNFVLSKGKNRISEEVYQLVHKTADYFEMLEDVLDIHDITMNPTGINKYLNAYAARNGKYVNERGTPYIKPNPEKGIEGDDPSKVTYIPNDPNQYTIIFIDHASLTKAEKNATLTKDKIDKLSEYLVFQRNLHKFSPVVVNQFNRTISSTDRFKLEMVRPQLSDFKDTGNTQQDANLVLATFSPNRYEISEYAGYDVSVMKDRFRALSVLKNRDGTPDVAIGLAYAGEIGYFRELPKSNKFSSDAAQKLITSIDSKKVQSEEEDEEIISNTTEQIF